MKKLFLALCFMFAVKLTVGQNIPLTFPMKDVEEFIPVGILIPRQTGTVEKLFRKNTGRIRTLDGKIINAVLLDSFAVGDSGRLYQQACEKRNSHFPTKYWRMAFIRIENEKTSLKGGV